MSSVQPLESLQPPKSLDSKKSDEIKKNPSDNLSQRIKNNSAATTSNQQKLMSAAIASLVDLPFAHPLETISRRKQFKSATSTTNILRKLNPTNFFNSFLHLYDGAGWSSLNKLSSRCIRFSAQSKIQEEMQTNFTPLAIKFLKKEQTEVLCGAVSGIVTATTETAITYPFDVLKTRQQLNAKNIFTGMYNGIGITWFRNAVAAGAFFGIFPLCKHLSNKISNDKAKNLLACIAASEVTTAFTNPLEVGKTVAQGSTSKIKAGTLLKETFLKNGLKSFTIGLFPRILMAPIKTALPYCFFIEIEKYFKKKNELPSLEKVQFCAKASPS